MIDASGYYCPDNTNLKLFLCTFHVQEMLPMNKFEHTSSSSFNPSNVFFLMSKRKLDKSRWWYTNANQHWLNISWVVLYQDIFSAYILIVIYLGKDRFCAVYIVSTTMWFWPIALGSHMQCICRWDGSTCWLLWEVNLSVQDQPESQCEWHWWRVGATIFGGLCAGLYLRTQDYIWL